MCLHCEIFQAEISGDLNGVIILDEKKKRVKMIRDSGDAQKKRLHPPQFHKIMTA